MLLQTLPTLGDDITVDDGSGPSTFDQMQSFLNSNSGTNILNNVLNMASTSSTGKPAIFKPGTVATAATSVDPTILIAGAVALGLILYFGKKG